jgi:hypothetical protein
MKESLENATFPKAAAMAASSPLIHASFANIPAGACVADCDSG